MQNLIDDFPEITAENRMDIFEIIRTKTLEMTSDDLRNGKFDPAVLAAVEEEMKSDITPEFREQIIASFARVIENSFEHSETIEDVGRRKKFYEQYIKMFEITMELAAVHMELTRAGK